MIEWDLTIDKETIDKLSLEELNLLWEILDKAGY